MRVLLINSDLHANRGDRAIAEGVIRLVRESLPGAEVTGLSEEAARDAEWFSVRMLRQGVHSLALWEFATLLREARRADLVLWGGGELLKDYTNRLSLLYWTLKMGVVSRVAKRVVGVYQGIGPTSSRWGQRRIVRAVSRTDIFLVRDAESREKLIRWGVPPERVRATFDCAVIPEPGPVERDPQKLAGAARLSPGFLESFVAVAPRDWFHYRRGGWLPYRWRRPSPPSEQNARYRSRLVELVDHLTAQYGNVLLVPMHMVEDPPLCAEIRARASQRDRVVVLDSEELSPSGLRALLGRARIMVAFRLHAGIIATSAGTPAITYYYVDKGRLYAQQAGIAEYSRPIEAMLGEDALADFIRMERAVHVDEEIRERLAARIDEMRDDVRLAFKDAVGL